MDAGSIVLTLAALAAAWVAYLLIMRAAARRRYDPERVLLGACADRALAALREKGELTDGDLAALVSGVRAGNFFTGGRVRVEDPAAFAPKVRDYLLSQGLAVRGGGDRYILKK
jgi:hypothetical protein